MAGGAEMQEAPVVPEIAGYSVLLEMFIPDVTQEVADSTAAVLSDRYGYTVNVVASDNVSVTLNLVAEEEAVANTVQQWVVRDSANGALYNDFSDHGMDGITALRSQDVLPVYADAEGSTKAPDDNSEAPDTSSEAPGTSSKAPDDTSSEAPDTSSNAPDESSKGPQSVSASPRHTPAVLVAAGVAMASLFVSV
jgi:hypothetical protein